jgi:glutathione peroxidase
MYKLSMFALVFIFAACFNASEIQHSPLKAESNAKLVSMKTTETPKTPFFDFKMKSIDGQEVSFAQYKGKKVIVLNVASKCGFTPQYADWEKFYKENKDKIVVLGFPCNQFMGQEPGESADIKTFCEKNYGVTFPIFEKIDVKGSSKAPLYAWLSDKSANGWCEKEPSWNFCKYLLNEKGELVNFFASKIKPDDAEFQKALGN